MENLQPREIIQKQMQLLLDASEELKEAAYSSKCDARKIVEYSEAMAKLMESLPDELR